MNAVLLTDEELGSLNLPADRQPPRVILAMKAGGIQGCYSTNGRRVEVTIVDFDEDFDRVRQADGSVSEAGVYRPRGVFQPEWVNADIIIEDEAA